MNATVWPNQQINVRFPVIQQILRITSFLMHFTNTKNQNKSMNKSQNINIK